MKLEKNEKFFFGKFKNQVGLIYIKKSFSNIFLTLTDLNNKVIISCSSGSSDNYFNKREKMSPYALEKMFKRVLLYLKLYNIQVIKLYLKLKIGAHVYFLIKELNYYGFSVSHIFEKNRLPHNGSKARKRPRK